MDKEIIDTVPSFSRKPELRLVPQLIEMPEELLLPASTDVAEAPADIITGTPWDTEPTVVETTTMDTDSVVEIRNVPLTPEQVRGVNLGRVAARSGVSVEEVVAAKKRILDQYDSTE